METNEFGAMLRGLRKQAGLDQRELADKIGINFTYLSKIESGVMPPPSEKVILRLAEVLDANKDELMILAGKIPSDIAQMLKNREALQFLRSDRIQKKIRAANKKEGINIIMKNLVNYKRLSRVGIALILVAAVAASMWFASPAPVKAVEATLPDLPTAMYSNSTYTFYAQVDINTNEAIPITKLRLDISGPTPAWVEFNADGSIISKSGHFQNITPVIIPYYDYNYRYGYGYGYQPPMGYGFFSHSWGYGYGYGYGYDVNQATQAKYRVTLNTTGMTLGTYTAQLSVLTGPGLKRFLSDKEQFTLSAPSPGGGFGGGAPPTPPTPGVTDVFNYINYAGRFIQDVTAESEDGKVKLTINEGTTGKTKQGGRLSEISILEMEEPPAPPTDASIIGLTYDLGPDGATFDPPATICFTYSPDEIPEGVNEKDLVIAVWDEDAGEWVVLKDSVVNTATHTICAPVSHFTAFTTIAPIAPAPPEEEEEIVAPPEEEVVAPPEEEEEIVAPPEEEEEEEALPEAPPKPINWWLIGGIISGVITIGVVTWLVVKRRIALA